MVEAARGPMLAVTEPGVHTITVMGPTQLLKTELINNIVGYFMHQDPSPILVVQPKVDTAEMWSKERLDPMLRDTPVLKGLIKDKRSRDGENTILHKGFPGGHVTVVGSNSPSDLASRPIRVVLADEIDKYKLSAGKEGDVIKLAEARTSTFWNALKVRVCSPTVEGQSRIKAEFELSDKRVFCGRCPHCDELDQLLFKNVKWQKEDPEGTACYVCSKCETPWTETDRLNAISKSEYVATAPFFGHAGFHVNRLASPWQPISALVKDWLASMGNTETHKVFINTQLAETWEEKGERPEHMRLYERREQYPLNSVPSQVAFLTCGVDVQKDRLELEIVGWGRDKQSWSTDYRYIMGETHTEAPWLELDKVLQETWLTEDERQLQIRMMSVDSGFNTQHVYDWVRKQSPARVRAIKGSDALPMVFGQPKDIDLKQDGSKLKRATKVWPLGVSIIKNEIYSWLKLDGAGDDGVYPHGFCHFPEYDEEYFNRLCSEQLVKKTVKNQTVYQWVKIVERNEPLDCRVYARGAAAMYGMDRFTDTDWDQLLGRVEAKSVQTPTPANKSTFESTRRIETSVNKNDFWARQRDKKLF